MTNRLPESTVITVKSEAGPPEYRPNPLINVASAVLGKKSFKSVSRGLSKFLGDVRELSSLPCQGMIPVG